MQKPMEIYSRCSGYKWQEEHLESNPHESERIAERGDCIDSHLEEHMDRQCHQNGGHEETQTPEGTWYVLQPHNSSGHHKAHTHRCGSTIEYRQITHSHLPQASDDWSSK